MTSNYGEIRRRVRTSIDVIGHPHNIGMAKSNDPNAEQAREKLPVIEGEHYTVLAYTMWSDYHTPTVIRWTHGPTDDFSNREESLENRANAIVQADGE